MLAEIKQKIERLIALYESEKRRGDSLAAELDKARAEADACRKQIDDLKDRISHLELKGAFMTAGDRSSAVARERIDTLVREIDKCISLLEKD